MDRLLRWVATLAVVAGGLAAAGCEDASVSPAQRAELDRAVAGYLDALAEAYSTLDVKPLEEWASPIEVATVRRILKSLVTTGDRVEATLRGYEVDRMALFRGINATVWVVEVWTSSATTRSAGSRREGPTARSSRPCCSFERPTAAGR